jgi:hypothetical protein
MYNGRHKIGIIGSTKPLILYFEHLLMLYQKQYISVGNEREDSSNIL